MKSAVRIIGGGLAGSEAAWQLLKRKIPVHLYEMRPHHQTLAHKTGNLAELVCSNSFKGEDISQAPGLLKAELRCFDSLILEAADASRVPAGKALAVNRDIFSKHITETLTNHPLCTIVHEEVIEPSAHDVTLITTGPLTSPSLSQWLQNTLGDTHLFFYDAISPIIEGGSIDHTLCFEASRYGAGNDYLNIPLTREQYEEFIDDLLAAEKVLSKDFEKAAYFEGCLPIEVMAERGRKTLAFGPMKPVGLIDPKTGRRSYAILQLRKENKEGTLYNMVGFQTKMKYPDQIRIFKKLPGLADAVFARLGSIHRNTFIHGPKNLNQHLQLKTKPHLFLAGQMIGVEGYMESTAMGLLAALNIQAFVHDKKISSPPRSTAIGALLAYVTTYPHSHYQPMNINFGLLSPLADKGKDKKMRMALLALEDIKNWKKMEGL